MAISTYACPELTIPNTGIAEAIILFDNARAKPWKIICGKYDCNKYICEEKLARARAEIEARYDLNSQTPNLAKQIAEEIKAGRKPEEGAEVEHLIADAIKEFKEKDIRKMLQSLEIKCTVWRGFRELP
jgi:hypothetical protein